MCVNGFNILDPEMTSIGTGIYLGASVIDHSCEPNALAVFEGTTLFIRTLTTLPILDWTQVNTISLPDLGLILIFSYVNFQVFICYIDLLNTPQDRQKELQANYYFLCQCSVCLDPRQISDMHSAICPNNKCEALIDMSNIAEDQSSCEKCGEIISNTFVDNYTDAIEFTNHHLRESGNMACILFIFVFFFFV